MNKAAQSLGRRGGRVTSEAKARAARANGAKGGRPGQKRNPWPTDGRNPETEKGKSK